MTYFSHWSPNLKDSEVYMEQKTFTYNPWEKNIMANNKLTMFLRHLLTFARISMFSKCINHQTFILRSGPLSVDKILLLPKFKTLTIWVKFQYKILKVCLENEIHFLYLNCNLQYLFCHNLGLKIHKNENLLKILKSRDIHLREKQVKKRTNEFLEIKWEKSAHKYRVFSTI